MKTAISVSVEICIYEGEESESGSLKYEFENIWRDPNKEETEGKQLIIKSYFSL